MCFKYVSVLIPYNLESGDRSPRGMHYCSIYFYWQRDVLKILISLGWGGTRRCEWLVYDRHTCSSHFLNFPFVVGTRPEFGPLLVRTISLLIQYSSLVSGRRIQGLLNSTKDYGQIPVVSYPVSLVVSPDHVDYVFGLFLLPGTVSGPKKPKFCSP